jgi:hypothetical protein
MKITGEKDLCLIKNKGIMKRKVLFFTMATLIILLIAASCNKVSKNNSSVTSNVNEIKPEGKDMILIGKGIITEVIVKADTLGDPWEVEKVKGYNGKLMFNTLFNKIYSKELTVYDCLSGEPLIPDKIKAMEKDYNSDISKISKITYLEDWYFNTTTNSIIKKIKSVSFGYEYNRGEGLPIGYKALFQIKSE